MNFSRLIASGFGSGFCPVAPGTAGSLAALGLGVLLMQLSPAALPIAAVLACILGSWSVHRAAAGAADPGWVVIDEFAGQWIAMLPLSRLDLSVASATSLLASFALFRLFDIAKPGPVGWADRRHDAIGVMADDVIAGAIAAAILWAILWLWPETAGHLWE
jgi:phosphatidylglycerophosphatase A